jgi:hypothetical protein
MKGQVMETYQLLETLYLQTALVRASTLLSPATINPKTFLAFLHCPGPIYPQVHVYNAYTYNFSHLCFCVCQTALSIGKPSHYSHVGLLLLAPVEPDGLASKVPSVFM